MLNTPVMLGMLLIVAEIFLIGIILLIYYFSKNKNKFVKSEKSQIPAQNKSVQSKNVALNHNDYSYWLTEIDKTRKALLSRNASALNNIDNTDYLALNVRLQCLELEYKLAQITPDKRSIESVEADLNGILTRFHIIHAMNVMHEKREGSENQETRNLIEHQKKTIDFLRKYTEEILTKILKQNEDFMRSLKNQDDVDKMQSVQQEFIRMSETMPEKINQLESINLELSQCVAVLEDENQFLRDQITALLKISETGKN